MGDNIQHSLDLLLPSRKDSHTGQPISAPFHQQVHQKSHVSVVVKRGVL